MRAALEGQGSLAGALLGGGSGGGAPPEAHDWAVDGEASLRLAREACANPAPGALATVAYVAIGIPRAMILLSMLGGVPVFGATGALLGPIVVRLCVESLAIASEGRGEDSS